MSEQKWPERVEICDCARFGNKSRKPHVYDYINCLPSASLCTYYPAPPADEDRVEVVAKWLYEREHGYAGSKWGQAMLHAQGVYRTTACELLALLDPAERLVRVKRADLERGGDSQRVSKEFDID